MGVKGNVQACTKTPPEVRQQIIDAEAKKKADKDAIFGESNGHFDDDEEEVQEIYDMMAGGKTAKRVKSVKGPMDLHYRKATKQSSRILQARRRHLYWTPCAAHCVDLMLEDIGKLERVKRAIQTGSGLAAIRQRDTLAPGHAGEESGDEVQVEEEDEMLRENISGYKRKQQRQQDASSSSSKRKAAQQVQEETSDGDENVTETVYNLSSEGESVAHDEEYLGESDDY
ncbi:hypothetical protein RIF29_38248 [Crotalaria pallida]|uniref:DUF659 domain-containing protein n=1 Tax=Crotalaria pallida TaxID=3830 RepID=A0AAN9HPI7_CROPI